MAHAVGPGDIRLRLARSKPLERLLALVGTLSFGGGPNFTPRGFARFLPSPLRAQISSRSNLALPASMVGSSRPWGGSNLAPYLMAERILIATRLLRSWEDRYWRG